MFSFVRDYFGLKPFPSVLDIPQSGTVAFPGATELDIPGSHRCTRGARSRQASVELAWVYSQAHRLLPEIPTDPRDARTLLEPRGHYSLYSEICARALHVLPYSDRVPSDRPRELCASHELLLLPRQHQCMQYPFSITFLDIFLRATAPRS